MTALARGLPFARTTMQTFFVADRSASTSPLREPPVLSRPAPKVTFLPPRLAETHVIRDPFERVSPRLRCLEFFEREVYS